MAATLMAAANVASDPGSGTCVEAFIASTAKSGALDVSFTALNVEPLNITDPSGKPGPGGIIPVAITDPTCVPLKPPEKARMVKVEAAVPLSAKNREMLVRFWLKPISSS